jgi:hypothetical protein
LRRDHAHPHAGAAVRPLRVSGRRVSMHPVERLLALGWAALLVIAVGYLAGWW